jgi:hypothetical protein
MQATHAFFALSVLLVAPAAAQTGSVKPAGSPTAAPAAVTASMTADPVKAAAIRRFIASPVATGYAVSDVLQPLVVSWAPYPDAARYLVLRASSQTGAWVADRQVVGTVDTIRGLPRNTPVYVRVVPLFDGKSAPAKIDSSVVVLGMTTDYGCRGSTVGCIDLARAFPVNVSCKPVPPAYQATVTWSALPGVTRYEVKSYLGQGTVYSPLATSSTTASSMTFNNVTAGHYRYEVVGVYDVRDWPQPHDTLHVRIPHRDNIGERAIGATYCP